MEPEQNKSRKLPCMNMNATAESQNLQGNDDKAKALAAMHTTHVRELPQLLKFQSDRLRDDEDVVLAFAMENRDTLQYASLRLRGHRGIIVKALATEMWWPFDHRSVTTRYMLRITHFRMNATKDGLSAISDELKSDREINLLVAKQCGWILNQDLFGNDKEIALATLSKWVFAWEEGHISEDLKRDADIVKRVLSVEPFRLEELSDDLRGNRDIVMMALDAYQLNGVPEHIEHSSVGVPPRFFRTVSEELRSDPEIIFKAVSKNGMFLNNVILPGGTMDLDIVKKAIENNMVAYRFVPAHIRDRAEVPITSWAIKSVSDDDSFDLDFVRSRLSQTLVSKLERVRDESQDRVVLVELRDVNAWLLNWKQPMLEKILIVSDRLKRDGVPKDARDKIFKDALLDDINLGHAILEVSPIIEALARTTVDLADFLAQEDDTYNEEDDLAADLAAVYDEEDE